MRAILEIKIWNGAAGEIERLKTAYSSFIRLSSHLHDPVYSTEQFWMWTRRTVSERSEQEKMIPLYDDILTARKDSSQREYIYSVTT